MLLVKSLCCLLNGKAIGGSRVKERWCIMYLEETCAICLLVRPRVRRELRSESVSCVRPSMGRGLRLDDVSCILRKLALFTFLWGLGRDESYDSKMFLVKNLRCLLNCKAFGGSRVKTRWCFFYLEQPCAMHLLVRPWVRRDFRKWFWWRTCVVYSIVRPLEGRGLRLDDVSCILRKLALCTCL